MGTAERRNQILKILCRRRYETIKNLSSELGVSTRTILRDIDVLSISNPIYTKSGRYEGGVYVVDSFTMDKMYMTELEIIVMKKVSCYLKTNNKVLSQEEHKIFDKIIELYSMPKL